MKFRALHLKVLILAAVTAAALFAGSSAAQAPASAKEPRDFESASIDVERSLAAAVAELGALRATVAEEKLPLARRLRELEDQLIAKRAGFQDTTRLLDSRTLDLSTLRGAIDARKLETGYLISLLSEYANGYESRLHIAELARHNGPVAAAKLARENTALGEEEVLEAQAALLEASVARLEDCLGGARFEGSAVDGEGLVRRGTFVLLGPAAIFCSQDGQQVGSVEQRLGSLEPALIAFADPAVAAAAKGLAQSGSGAFPLDPTLGNAVRIAATDETLIEHIKKGGPVMWPIFLMAGAALIVVLYKWVTIQAMSGSAQGRLQPLLSAVGTADRALAVERARAIPGPVGEMLAAGAEHLGEPRELIEEVMYEKVLATRLRLNRMLPFVAISASSAPLLGLLGTVTGIMNTFTLMTVFGTGDVKTLSSGISEALITTEYGLIVAIPSLLLYSFLSRKARGIVDGMEKAAVAFLNQVARSPKPQLERAAAVESVA